MTKEIICSNCYTEGNYSVGVSSIPALSFCSKDCALEAIKRKSAYRASRREAIESREAN
jgi:hypothetical protein